jgi:hypothetical protein
VKSNKTISIKAALAGIHLSARRKASRRNLPVAISEGEKTILLYPDGTRKPYTPEAIAALRDSSSVISS